MAVTITYTIPGVPLINQLNSPTSDGLPDENARMNCVFASNAALATAYLHRPFNPDQLKDMDSSYGQGYTGGASEKNLVDTMAKLGIKVARVAHDTQQGLIDEIHHHVPQGHGVIVTMPSQWGTAPSNPRAYSGPSHVGLACGVGPGTIRVMNPWGGFWQDESDSWWAARLLDGEVWVGEYVGGGSTVGVPKGWNDDGATLKAPNGVPVVAGFREKVLSWPGGWAANNTPLASEQHVSSGSVEYANRYAGPGSRQDFRFCTLCWTVKAGVYVMAIGQDVVWLAQQFAQQQQQAAQIASLQQQLAAAQAQIGDPKAKAVAEAIRALVS